MKGIIGEVRLFGGNFAPRDWAFCDGQLIAVSQYTELFSLIGNTYGGDGRVNFCLPDLRGRTAISYGKGTGLTDRALGLSGGTEGVILTGDQFPSHTHKAETRDFTLNPKVRVANAAQVSSPEGAYLADAGMGNSNYSDWKAEKIKKMASALTLGFNTEVIGESEGKDKAHNNMQPFLVVNYIICLQGDMPSRS